MRTFCGGKDRSCTPGPRASRRLRAMIGVAFLDDHPAVRAGLQAILATESDLRLVGSAAGEHELWPLLERTHPAVVILDLHHPGRDGLALCLQIKRKPDAPAVLLYSAYTPAPLIAAAAVAGAGATVRQARAATTLVQALRALQGGSPPQACWWRWAARCCFQCRHSGPCCARSARSARSGSRSRSRSSWRPAPAS